MKTRQVIKIGIDISMTVLLFILMAFHYVGLQWHEVTGAVMLVLFILHHILNGNWYRALGKGKYSSGRILFTIVDVVLLIDMFLLMFSGISMSRYVFRFGYSGQQSMGEGNAHDGILCRVSADGFPYWASLRHDCGNDKKNMSYYQKECSVHMGSACFGIPDCRIWCICVVYTEVC